MLRFFLRTGIYAFLLSLPSFLLSQQLAFKQYNRATGLPSDYILCMLQDRSGFLWFGTDRGASRYDGHSFRTFTVADGLGSNFVRRIFEDRDGVLWFGLIEGGVTRFDGTSLQTYTTAEGLISNNVLAIEQDRAGRLYFRTDRGISILSNHRFLQLPTHRGSVILARLPDGSVAFHDSLSLYRITIDGQDSVRVHEIPVSLFKVFAVNPAGPQEAKLLSNGDLGVVGRNGVLFISDILSVRPSARWLERGKPFTDIAELRGTYWLTMENIPHLVSIRGNKSTAHDRKDAVPSEELITLLADREGNLWIGTLGSGAMKLLGEHLLVYNTASGLPTRNITTVFEDSQGRVWFGSSEGVSLLTGGRLLPNIRPLRRDANGEVVNTEYRAARSFAEDESGTLFIGTFMRAIGPASAEDYRSASPVRSMPIPWGVSAISIQHTGGDKAVWVATYGDGVYRLRKRDTTRFYQRDGLVSDMIEAIVPGQDAVWFLSRNHGASRWNNHRFETFSARSHGLPSDAIYSLAEEAPDRIWFGTDRGLVLYHRGRIRTWDQGDGLIGTYVLGIIPHRDTSMPDSGDGSLWIITDKMIHRLRQDVIERFGSNPLLHTDDASINQVYHVRGTSRVWIATTLGALRLDLSVLRRTRTPPMTVITEILADTVHITPSTVTMPEGKFPHGVNDLTVRFAGLSFSHEPSVRYQYRLEAKEQLWSAPTAESMVRYRQLPPGSYTLAVRAINPDGIPSTQPARFSFEILPPFYATWWFQAVLGLVILGALGGTIRYVELRRYQRELARLEREHAVNAERERTRARIARDLHDDLSSTLGSIALYAESLKRTLRAPTAETRLLLEKIATLAGGAIDAMGDIVWSVAPQHDTLSSVLGRIQHVTAELCALNQIAYTIRLPTVDDDIQLPDQVRRNLYLIVKEALTNSIKHAHAAEISIRGRLEHGVFELVVADTGVGLRAARRTKHSRTTLPSTGHGLQNMKSRAEEIGAELAIRSGSRKGTEICLRVRLGNGPRRENEA